MSKTNARKMWVHADFRTMLKKRAAEEDKSVIELTRDLSDDDPFESLLPVKKRGRNFKIF